METTENVIFNIAQNISHNVGVYQRIYKTLYPIKGMTGQVRQWLIDGGIAADDINVTVDKSATFIHIKYGTAKDKQRPEYTEFFNSLSAQYNRLQAIKILVRPGNKRWISSAETMYIRSLIHNK